MPSMTNQQKMELIAEINRLIFSNTPQTIHNTMINPIWKPWILFIKGRTFKNSTTGEQSLRGFDIGLDLGDTDQSGVIKPKKLRFIEQNPDKIDANGHLKQTALLARQGNQIVWIIDQDLENGFIGKITNGVYEPTRRNAIYPTNFWNIPTNPPNPRQATDQFGNEYILNYGTWQNALPEINGHEIENTVTKYFEAQNNEEYGDNDECGFETYE